MCMDDAEIVKEFLVESYENLDRLDQELIALEADPHSHEILASIFRTIHTLKGTSGFLAFNQLEKLTHAGENLLVRLRDGLLELTPEITTALLATVDTVRQILAQIETTGSESERDDSDLMAALARLLDPEAATASEPNRTSAIEPSAARAEPPDEMQGVPQNIGEILIGKGIATPHEVQEAIEQQSAGDPRHLGEILVEKGAVKPKDVVEALQAQQQARGWSASESTIRVDVSQLDKLMNRVGELVLLRNQIAQYANTSEDSALFGTSQRLNLLTTELQESVMKTRMQPIGTVWSKFLRTARDLAVNCGKQVHIEMEGQDTELDKTIIEAIKGPLTHLVRNAVDHGIESRKTRIAAGKNPEGLLRLRAFHEGGQVNIEIIDDGAGLDLERIRKKAVQNELITIDRAAHLTEHEITNLIFLPGFSTASVVTNVSGRGVGMDVVRANIEKVGGAVDVQSRPGHGSIVRMKIPVTLAIIPALIVTSSGDRYAIPQGSLLELVRLEDEQVRRGIELIQGVPVYRFRGNLLPLVSLNQILQLNTAEAPLNSAKQADKVQTINIVVLRADDRQFGLMVDEINDTQEIVVKPISKQLKSVNTYAGATIMGGDGRVALILDVHGLAQYAKAIGEAREQAMAENEEKSQVVTEGKAPERNTVLVFHYGRNRRMAIDLSLVSRLEEFAASSIETAAGQEVVQYRGEIMPLVRVSDALENRGQRAFYSTQEPLHVLVYAEQARRVGLVVDRILDIIEEPFVVQPDTRRAGILGSAIIQKRVTDILDVRALIAASGISSVVTAVAHA